MIYEWDEAKRRANIEKHGVDFDLVWQFEWARAAIEKDGRRNYGEERFRATGPAGTDVFVVAFTHRSPAIRVISMRKANRREEEKYEKES